MIKTVKISLILIFVVNIYLPLIPEEYFNIQINKDGWELPNIDAFTPRGKKIECREPFKNCFEEYYKANEKINFHKTFIKKTSYNEMPCVEIYSIDFVIEGLTIIYYKTQPFCCFYGGEIGCYKSFLVLLDMDLDGKYELMLSSPVAKKFFLKYSPRVNENDRYKGDIIID